MLEAAIFDMDGVLLDNHRHHLKAWKQLGREAGRVLTDDQITATFGQRNQDMLRALISPQLKPLQLEKLAYRKEEIYREIIAPDLKSAAIAGLLPFLHELKLRGHRCAVATSGPIENVEFVVAGLGLGDLFDAVVTSADVRRGKPDPEVFLVAAHRLRADPRRSAVFEDSPSGIKAALAASSYTVAVATTHPPERLVELEPDAVIRDFEELSTAQLEEALRLRSSAPF